MQVFEACSVLLFALLIIRIAIVLVLQTLALAQLNEQEPPPSTPPAVNNQEIPAASVGTSIHHTSPASGISPSESTQSATSRKSSKPTMAERLGTVDDPPTYNLFAMTVRQMFTSYLLCYELMMSTRVSVHVCVGNLYERECMHCEPYN